MLAVFACSLSVAWAAPPPLPPAETAMADTVGPWNLPFSDQLRLYREGLEKWARLTGRAEPAFALGVETSLRKVLPVKYWFKGEWTDRAELSAARNEAEAFQLAVLPRIHAPGDATAPVELRNITVVASELHAVGADALIPASAVTIHRVGFVETHPVGYPRLRDGRWPDVLWENGPVDLAGTDLGLFWVEIDVPETAAPGRYAGEITVSAEGVEPVSLTVDLRVWDFTLPERPAMPMLVWTKGDPAATGKAGEDYLAVAKMFCRHHLDPISVGRTWDLEALDRNLDALLPLGLMYFQAPGYKSDRLPGWYEHVKQRGLLDKALIYGAHDEPLLETFENAVVPQTRKIRERFPGLKVFLASAIHPGMDRGVDIVMTDLSTGFHEWLAAGRPGDQQLWWYFCHLPIRVHFDRPLVHAPNMLVDYPALEHRLPYWMVDHYGVKGMFIWAGNNSWPKDLSAWQAEGFPCVDQHYPYPYGGKFNGNGYLLYPGPRPSIRLKVLRDGAEDWAYLQAARALAAGDGPRAAEAAELLESIRPRVFVDTHYFSRDPADILEMRLKLGELLDRDAKK
jgi:hypothetical protein